MEIKKTVYVEDEFNFIYKMADVELRADGWLNITLKLVCGIDYINPDASDVRGYVDNKNFIEEAQCEIFTCDIMNESINEAIKYNGYKKIKKLPKINVTNK